MTASQNTLYIGTDVYPMGNRSNYSQAELNNLSGEFDHPMTLIKASVSPDEPAIYRIDNGGQLVAVFIIDGSAYGHDMDEQQKEPAR